VGDGEEGGWWVMGKRVVGEGGREGVPPSDPSSASVAVAVTHRIPQNDRGRERCPLALAHTSGSGARGQSHGSDAASAP
jgi:hypothetical protein